MNLNRGISTPIAILLIVVVAAIVGVGIWQFTATNEEPESNQPSNYATQASCEDAGYHWYDNSCHEEKSWQCGDKVSYKGQDYNTAKIGSQCWFAENINVGKMINGEKMQTDNEVIEKYCYQNKESNCDVYGGLYQWEEAVQYNNKERAQGICPEGWHVPSDDEFCTLEQQICQNLGHKNCSSTFNCENTEYRGETEGSALAGSDSLWQEGALVLSEKFSNSPLKVLPAGYRSVLASYDFEAEGYEANF